MTTEELEAINRELEAGDKPAEIAARRDMTHFQLRYELSKAGRVIVTYRRLELAAAIDEPREVAAA